MRVRNHFEIGESLKLDRTLYQRLKDEPVRNNKSCCYNFVCVGRMNRVPCATTRVSFLQKL